MQSSPCRLCGAAAGPDDPDPCWGWLDGVAYACCGHGDLIRDRYISTLNGRVFRGPSAMPDYMDWLETREGRAAAALTMHHREMFGWNGGRNRHACGLLYGEHSCRRRDGSQIWPGAIRRT